ncbi:hypothetical protein [Streptosporangium sp. V21-05]|uniref:hypothetical protein n=1 Tax=Streptosporangium sp. V21-05 TaxID=3446115 RepID=UPI003F538D37
MTSRSAPARDRNPGRPGHVALFAVVAAYACMQVLLYTGTQRTSGVLGPAAELFFNRVVDGLTCTASRTRVTGSFGFVSVAGSWPGDGFGRAFPSSPSSRPV